jgi:hypothetical protein
MNHHAPMVFQAIGAKAGGKVFDLNQEAVRHQRASPAGLPTLRRLIWVKEPYPFFSHISQKASE